MRAGLTVGFFAISAAGCSAGAGAGAESPSQLLSSAAHALKSDRSFHVKGGFTINSVETYVDAHVLANGDASGSLTLGSYSVGFIEARGETYYDHLDLVLMADLDSTIADLAGRLQGEHWWHVTPSSSAASALGMLHPDTYVSRFLSGRAHLAESSQRDLRSRPAIKLSDRAGSVFVATATPHQVLEIRTDPHYLAVDASTVDLAFDSFNSPVQVVAPADAITPTSEGMPAYFAVESLGVDGSCSSTGCPVKAVITTLAGHGTTSISFTITDANGHTLATCRGAVAVDALGGTATARCHASGSGWYSFYVKGGSYQVLATAANPNYAGG